MAQNWDPKAYAQTGAFVHGLAGGVLEWLDAKPGERILDLGCGDGHLTLRIAALGAMVTGVDASTEMVPLLWRLALTPSKAMPRRCLLPTRHSMPYFRTPSCTGSAIRMP